MASYDEDADLLRRKLTQLAVEYKAAAEKLNRKVHHNAVLKRAIIEEKRVTEELKQQTQHLKEKLEEKTRVNQEQLRKIDRLTFNASRLKKRCEKLQEHIRSRDEEDNKSWGLTYLLGWGNPAPQQRTASRRRGASTADGAKDDGQKNVIEEELMSKIKENERLHMQVFELKQDRAREVEELQKQLEDKASCLKSKEEELNQRAERVKTLEQQVSTLSQEIESKNKERRQLQMVQGITDRQAQSQTIEMANKIQELELHVANHVMFNDKKRGGLGALSLPLFDCESLKMKRQAVGQCLDTCRNLQLHLVTLLRHVVKLVGHTMRSIRGVQTLSQDSLEEYAKVHGELIQLIPRMDNSVKRLSAFLEQAHIELGILARGGNEVLPSEHISCSAVELAQAIKTFGECCYGVVNGVEAATNFASQTNTIPYSEETLLEFKDLCTNLKGEVKAGLRHLSWVEDLMRFAENKVWGKATNQMGRESSQTDAKRLLPSISDIPAARQRLFTSVLKNPRVSSAVEWLSEPSHAYQALLFLALGTRPGPDSKMQAAKYLENIQRIVDLMAENVASSSTETSFAAMSPEIVKCSLGMSNGGKMVCKLLHQLCDAFAKLAQQSKVDEAAAEGVLLDVGSDHRNPRSSFTWKELSLTKRRSQRFLQRLNQSFDSSMHRNKSYNNMDHFGVGWRVHQGFPQHPSIEEEYQWTEPPLEAVEVRTNPDVTVQMLQTRIRSLEAQLQLAQPRVDFNGGETKRLPSESKEQKMEEPENTWRQVLRNEGVLRKDSLEMAKIGTKTSIDDEGKDDLKYCAEEISGQSRRRYSHSTRTRTRPSSIATQSDDIIQSQPGRIHSNTGTPPDPSSRRHSMGNNPKMIPELGEVSPTTTQPMTEVDDIKGEQAQPEKAAETPEPVEKDSDEDGAFLLPDDDARLVRIDADMWTTLRHHRHELERLQEERRQADKKAQQMHLLLHKTATRLFKVIDRCQNAEQGLFELKQEDKKLREDLVGSKIQYEKMIQNLTVHICELTEKLASKDAMLEHTVVRRSQALSIGDGVEIAMQKRDIVPNGMRNTS
eukprot:CAMPEP_0114530666 /NCGR_PEP_ID=MMETSP0109-20121206/25582_1 /TAXON_ID=29199 /ORGANISM="Chlorarachnion reptans, Strain CCCM449" /LENGTH=1060 /DNA_ID=CAMNT_0001713335 /DNA_START=67 /DNA_END=3247 /DNA_ORIENTATION=-